MKHYLMVHDLVWINTTVTGATVPFDYARIEAVIAAQYDYGAQRTDLQIAGQVLERCLSQPPFAYGNRRTALVAVVTLMNGNGCALKVDDAAAAETVRRVASRDVSADEAVASLFEPADIGVRPGMGLRLLVTHICNAHTDALTRLTEGDEK